MWIHLLALELIDGASDTAAPPPPPVVASDSAPSSSGGGPDTQLSLKDYWRKFGVKGAPIAPYQKTPAQRRRREAEALALFGSGPF